MMTGRGLEEVRRRYRGDTEGMRSRVRVKSG
jgi:hypothetical protein